MAKHQPSHTEQAAVLAITRRTLIATSVDRDRYRTAMYRAQQALWEAMRACDDAEAAHAHAQQMVDRHLEEA